MALQGRKPGWLLDRILGRESPEEAAPPPPAGPAEPSVHAPPPMDAWLAEPPVPPDAAVEPPALSPASWSEGQPDFTPASFDIGLFPSRPEPEAPLSVDEMPGATLQPVEPATPEARGDGEAASPSASGGSDIPAPPPPLPPPLPPEAFAAAPPPSSPAAVLPAPAAAEPTRSWFRRLADGMGRTSSAIGERVTSLFTKARLDAATLEDLEDALIGADLGVETATRITAALGSGRYDREISPGEVRAIMAGEIEKVLAPVARPLVVDQSRKPFVLLMVGVNGAGKTTTIGKLAHKFRRDGLSVTIAAGDTFRAAAIEQLKVWGERVGAPVIARAQGADAAGLAFDALEEARGHGADVLMIDTAGRLQNKTGLMAELEKIVRVLRKLDSEAPHATLLVLDATVGQNAVSQVELFGKAAGITGLVMTKLDGTARGGILVALAAKFGLPVHFVGVGETVDDLQPFTARDFARALAGLEED